MMEEISKALDVLNGLNAQMVKAQLLLESDHDMLYLVPGDDPGSFETLRIEKPDPLRVHEFYSLSGFTEYLNGPHCQIYDDPDRTGLVMVGELEVVAELNYRRTGSEQAILPLIFSEERMAWESLSIPRDGMTQKELWKVLVTDLDGCVNPQRAMEVAALKVSASHGSSVQISASGLSDESSQRSVAVSVPGGSDGASRTVMFPEVWSWEGRIWSCYDKIFEANSRLILSADDGLRFHFHPIREETLLRLACDSLVEDLKKSINGSRFTVHEGCMVHRVKR